MSDQPQNPNDGSGENGDDSTPTPGYGTSGDQPGYGTGPAYGDADFPAAGTPGGFPAAPRTNPLAIGSLAASIFGLLCCIGGIVGIVLGLVAVKQIDQSGENGRKLAVAGIVVGAVTIALSVLGALVFRG